MSDKKHNKVANKNIFIGDQMKIILENSIYHNIHYNSIPPNIDIIRTILESNNDIVYLTREEEKVYKSLTITLTKVQKDAIRSAIGGKNVWIYGGSRTGKSHTMNLIETGIIMSRPKYDLINHKKLGKYTPRKELCSDGFYHHRKMVAVFSDYEIDSDENQANPLTDLIDYHQIIGSSDQDKLPKWIKLKDFEFFHLTETF